MSKETLPYEKNFFVHTTQTFSYIDSVKDARKITYQLFMKEYLRYIAGIDENVGRTLKNLDDKNYLLFL